VSEVLAVAELSDGEYAVRAARAHSAEAVA